MRASFRRPKAALLAWLLGILAAGAFLTWWQVGQADRSMRSSLLENTRLVERAVDVNSLRKLSGTAADLMKPEYLRLKDQLAATRDANPQCRFLYLMGRRADGTIFFFADNESADSKDCSPAGQVYDEASSCCRRVFDTHEGAVDGPISDRWGTWVSGLVPILDGLAAKPGAGGLVAVLGMDIDARAWNGILARAALPPILLTLVLCMFLSTGSMLLHRRSSLVVGPPRWMKYIESALAIAIGLSLTLFATWEAHKYEAVARIRIFEQIAGSQISYVTGILRDIRDSELNGLAHICESNKLNSSADFKKQTFTLTKNPAVQAWAWVPTVPAEDKASFEAAARTVGGMPGFEIWRENWQGLRALASDRQTYYPFFFVAPMETNETWLGYDLGSANLLNTAIKAAATTGLVTATDPATLFQDAGGDKCMVIFHPIFEGGTSLPPSGFAVAVLRMDFLLPKAAANSTAFMDLFLLRKNAHPELLASNCSRNSHPIAEAFVTQPIFAFGKVFTVTAYSNPNSLRWVRTEWLTAFAGLFFTASVVVVIGLVRRQQRILKEALFSAPASSL